MGGVVRILLIVVVIVALLAGAAFFLLPHSASRSQTLTIERPAPSVLARLASTPPNTQIAEGITLAEAATVEGDTVTAPITFADGTTGRVVYQVTPEGEGSQVVVRVEQDLGANPIVRLQGLTGGEVGPLVEAAATAVTADLTALPSTSFEGLQYSVVQVAPQPFFYVENCSSSDAESVVAIITQAVDVIPAVMRRAGLTPAGPLMAVEPRVVEGQYCYQVGYPYTGRQPRALLVGRTGETPSGTMLRVVYTGTEDDVIEQVYDPMDALLAAAHLDDPSTGDDDWVTYEVYHDDPTQAGGSRNREIFYVSQGDIAALTRIQPAVEAAPVPTATPEAATESATPEAAAPEAAPTATPEAAPATPEPAPVTP
jgi:hypothetical protein